MCGCYYHLTDESRLIHCSNDQDAAIDHSLFTDHIPLTPPVCTNNTTTIEVDSKLSNLEDSIEFTSLQPGDVIGKNFASVEDAESFYNNYSKFVEFNTRKDEKRRDKQGVITIRRWVCSKQGYRAQKDELQTSDADCVISYLTAKAVIDPEFFFDYTLDEDDRFGNLFWADSTSRSDYGYFGDVLAFDATYKTNVYRRPLVMLIGVNHHNSTAIFGFGLLGDETIETYTWLLRTFLVSMHGKMP
ncbi:hypothetical protein Dsin_009123 [Dipteronia sinensis]|uniref:Protein FAR1-RELATED SEQUENCE n=1 Tax=Dipteronia sinensis TaxID=43782 RepID=A0AAE0EBB8_9ROSI|nr:hypothetical protein Dsin_009123 [Dipteronia sinensis]